MKSASFLSIIAACVALWALSENAQASEQCRSSHNSRDVMNCYGPLLERADAAVLKRQRQLQKLFESSPILLKKLNAAEALWHQYREATCVDLLVDLYTTGNMAQANSLVCKYRLTKGHLESLEGVFAMQLPAEK